MPHFPQSQTSVAPPNGQLLALFRLQQAVAAKAAYWDAERALEQVLTGSDDRDLADLPNAISRLAEGLGEADTASERVTMEHLTGIQADLETPDLDETGTAPAPDSPSF